MIISLLKLYVYMVGILLFSFVAVAAKVYQTTYKKDPGIETFDVD